MLLSYIMHQARHSQEHLPRPKNALHDKQVLGETSEPGNKGGLGGVGGCAKTCCIFINYE